MSNDKRKPMTAMPMRMKTLVAAICAASGLTAVPSVYAQGVIEEIVITSRRYEESINDAPVAVNVMSESFLEKNRIDRADDIFNYTPGATYESFSKLQPTASLRGLNAPTPGNASSESSIQTVVDSVVVTKDFMKGTPIFDLGRVEVLRGPQGTAFGRNASAGLLHFVTNRPEFDETYGSVSATLGSDERREIDGFFNMPLSETAALRVSFSHEEEDGQTDGFIYNETTSQIESIGGIDGEEATAIRVQLALAPSDNFSANFKLEYSQDRDESPIRELCEPGAGIGSFGLLDGGVLEETITDACDTPFKAFISERDDPDFEGLLDPADFSLDREILTTTAELSWALDSGINITSVTGYMDGESDNLSDILGTVADVTWQSVTNVGYSLSTELRVDNTSSDAAVQWLGGVYLLKDEETRSEKLLFAQRDQRAPSPFVPTTRTTGGTNETTSWSVFGEVSFDLSDRATLTYGGRYLTDDKDYITRAAGIGVNRQLGGLPGVGGSVLDENGVAVAAQCADNSVGGPDSTCNVKLDAFAQSDSWSKYISKLSLDYALTDTLNAYALYSEGFKSGAFQPDALNVEQASQITQPEESTNFEIGLKGESGAYRYAVTLFNITLDDVQTVNIVPVGTEGAFAGITSNIGEITNTGIEFDGAYAITDKLTISGGFALMDPELGGNTPDPTGILDPDTLVEIDGEIFGETLILDGQRPGGAPEWTVNIALDYVVELSGGSTVALRTDFRGRDDVWFQTRDRFSRDGTALLLGDDSGNTFSVAGDDVGNALRPNITDFGAQASWTNADETVNVTLWAKNLREDVDISNIGPFAGGNINDNPTGFRGKREFGLTASYDF